MGHSWAKGSIVSHRARPTAVSGWTLQMLGHWSYVNTELQERHNVGFQEWSWAQTERMFKGFSIGQDRGQKGGNPKEHSSTRGLAERDTEGNSAKYGLWRKEHWPVCTCIHLEGGWEADMKRMVSATSHHLYKEVYLKAFENAGCPGLKCPGRLSWM